MENLTEKQRKRTILMGSILLTIIGLIETNPIFLFLGFIVAIVVIFNIIKLICQYK